MFAYGAEGLALQCFSLVQLSFSAKHIYICIHFYSYSRIGTDGNNMKIKNVDCVVDSERLETTVRM